MTTATADLDELTLREIENALRLPCEMPDCLSNHGPATWEIEVRHDFRTCDVGRLLICGQCRDGLHRYRHQQIACVHHGALGYSVAAWWRPVRVLP